MAGGQKGTPETPMVENQVSDLALGNRTKLTRATGGDRQTSSANCRRTDCVLIKDLTQRNPENDSSPSLQIAELLWPLLLKTCSASLNMGVARTVA